MKIFFPIVIVLLFAFPCGCEKTLTDSNLPYKEVLVIRGVVKAGDVLDSLYVGRTLPYEEQINTTNQQLESWVKDANITVSEGSQIYTLKYYRNGLYRNDTLRIQTGKTYRLHVEWNGKIANAVTMVPEIPILDSVTAVSNVVETYEYGADETEYITHGYCRARKNEVFSFTTSLEITFFNPNSRPTTQTHIYGSDNVVAKRIQGDYSVADVLKSKILSTIGVSQNATITNKKIICTLKCYDESFYKYYLTYGNNDENISLEPRPVAWNVTGDAIGMFIGTSESVLKSFTLQ